MDTNRTASEVKAGNIGGRWGGNFPTFDGGHSLRLVLWNIVFVLFLLSLLGLLIRHLFSTDLGGTSWLINYQGGFVRRGLAGEILLFFATNFSVDVQWTIKIFCLFCYAAVSAFFIKSFLNRGYSLYILPICFFLGGPVLGGFWATKDLLFICIFIPILWVYGKDHLPLSAKVLIINTLAAFMILNHEVFAFIALPILFLLLFNLYKNNGVFRSAFLALLLLSPSILCFLLCVLHRGTPGTVSAILASWAPLLGTIATKTGEVPVAIAALGWATDDAFRFHIQVNFLSRDWGIGSLLAWTVTFPLVYYIASNALLAFRKCEHDFTEHHKTVLSSLLFFQLLCLFPVFALLSCDYLRVIFYWTASSFALFLLVPREKIESLFPGILFHFVKHFNNVLAHVLPPSKTSLAFLMLFLGITPVFFNIIDAFRTTMFYNVLSILSFPLMGLFGIEHGTIPVPGSP